MKHFIPTLLFLGMASGLFAQLGINGRYLSNEAPEWQYVSQGQEEALLQSTTFNIGIDYWIPLKNYRIDFLPEINISTMNKRLASREENRLANTWVSFFLNTNIYLFDLEGDCDCPTFSKSGNFFQKGFFVQLSPGFTWMRNETKEEEVLTAVSNDYAFSLGGGLGFDIGLSDIVTVSPIAGFRYFFPVEWNSLEQLQFLGSLSDDSIKGIDSSIRQFYAGLRLGFRLDQR